MLQNLMRQKIRSGVQVWDFFASTYGLIIVQLPLLTALQDYMFPLAQLLPPLSVRCRVLGAWASLTIREPAQESGLGFYPAAKAV